MWRNEQHPTGFGFGQNRGYRNYQRRNSGRTQDYSPYGWESPKQMPKKHSGCKFVMCEDGTMIVSAWCVKGRQLLSIYARPYKGTKKIESKSGKIWLNYFVTIVNKTTLQETKTSALFDQASKRLYIKDFNMICTTGGQGGYCGTHIKK